MKRMRISFWLWAGILIAGLAILAGCGGTSQPAAKQTKLTFATATPLRSADIAQVMEFSGNLALRGSVVEGLTRMRYGKDGKVEWVPQLAESWERLAPDKWRFKLRKGVTFHNGQEMTADDVVFSIQKMTAKESEKGQDFATATQPVVVDKYTVDITTKVPDAFLYRGLYHLEVQPKGWGIDNNKEEAKTKAMGTGPYRLVSLSDARDNAKFEAYDKYWGDKPTITQIEYRAIPDDGARLAALKSGEIQVAFILSPDLLSAAPAALSAPSSEVELLRIGATNNPPLDDVRIRQALNMAVDRQKLIKDLRKGYAGPANAQGVPPSSFGYNDSVTDYPYDPKAAKALVDQVPGAAGRTLSMWCVERYGKIGLDSCAALADMVNAIGFKVEIKVVPYQQWLQEGLFAPQNKLKAPDLWWVQTGNDVLIATPWMTAWHGCESGRVTFCDQNWDKQIKAAAAETDADKQKKLWQEVMAKGKELAPMVWVSNPHNAVGIASNVTGVLYPTNDDAYWNEWRYK